MDWNSTTTYLLEWDVRLANGSLKRETQTYATEAEAIANNFKLRSYPDIERVIFHKMVEFERED